MGLLETRMPSSQTLKHQLLAHNEYSNVTQTNEFSNWLSAGVLELIKVPPLLQSRSDVVILYPTIIGRVLGFRERRTSAQNQSETPNFLSSFFHRSQFFVQFFSMIYQNRHTLLVLPMVLLDKHREETVRNWTLVQKINLNFNTLNHKIGPLGKCVFYTNRWKKWFWIK